MGWIPDLPDLNVLIITPAARGTRKGNRVTALRWARHLRALRHRVRIAQAWEGQACDLMVALHARRSAASIVRFREKHPGAPLVVALTGTDIYQDFPGSSETLRSLELADRLIVLQPLAVEVLPAHVRSKARVIFQSATASVPAPVAPGVFQVCLLAHLREVKDTFLAAQAVRRLPERSRIQIIHLGAALDADAQTRARDEMAANPRYVWLGEQPRAQALSILAGSRLLLVLSHLEGGANVVSEALAANVPIISTRIPGSVGILGTDYAGYFPVGDAAALAVLLERAEVDREFMASLTEGIRRVRTLVEPARERAAWDALLDEVLRT